MDVIRHQIRALRQRNTDGKWFIPDRSLESVLEYEAVQTSLQDYCGIEPYGVKWMTRAIRNGSRKIFAILILIREEKKVGAFLEHFLQSDDQILDFQLPFSPIKLEEVLPQAVANEFSEHQWEFLAPIFTHRLLHRNITSEVPLPFVESRTLGKGGFGKVFEIVIPAGHHDFKNIDSTKVYSSRSTRYIN